LTVITEREKENLDIDGRSVEVVPLYEWLGCGYGFLERRT
jgi:hypothetical protein